MFTKRFVCLVFTAAFLLILVHNEFCKTKIYYTTLCRLFHKAICFLGLHISFPLFSLSERPYVQHNRSLPKPARLSVRPIGTSAPANLSSKHKTAPCSHLPTRVSSRSWAFCVSASWRKWLSTASAMTSYYYSVSLSHPFPPLSSFFTYPLTLSFSCFSPYSSLLLLLCQGRKALRRCYSTGPMVCSL